MTRTVLTALVALGIAVPGISVAEASATPASPALSTDSCLTSQYDQWDSTTVTNHCTHPGPVSIAVWGYDPPCYTLPAGKSVFFRHQGHGAAYFC